MNMKTIDIDDAVEGMALASDLCDTGGNILLGQGATLSEASLRSLRRRGIGQLDIVGTQEEAAGIDEIAASAERLRRCERLDHVFRRSAALLATPQLLARLRRYRCGEPA